MINNKFIKKLISIGKKHKTLFKPVLFLVFICLFIYHFFKEASNIKRWAVIWSVVILLGTTALLLNNVQGGEDRYNVDIISSDGISYTVDGLENGKAVSGSSVTIDYKADGCDYNDVKVMDKEGNLVSYEIDKDGVYKGKVTFKVETFDIIVELRAGVEIEKDLYYIVFKEEPYEYGYKYSPSSYIEVLNNSENKGIKLTSNIEGKLFSGDMMNDETIMPKETKRISIGLVEGLKTDEYLGKIKFAGVVYEETAQDNVEKTIEEGKEVLDETSSLEKEIEFTIDLYAKVNRKVVSKLELPNASDITYGQMLEKSVLSYESTYGEFKWQKNDELLKAGQHEEYVIFYPKDTKNYNFSELKKDTDIYNSKLDAFRLKVIVNVKKAVVYITVPDQNAKIGDKTPVIDKSQWEIEGLINNDNISLLNIKESVKYSEEYCIKSGVNEPVYPVIEADNYDVKFKGAKLTVNAVIPDETYFTVEKSGNNGWSTGLKIKPAGKDGFTKIRAGNSGEFTDIIVIDKSTPEGVLDLYFIKNNGVTEKYEYSYKFDNELPHITNVKLTSSGTQCFEVNDMYIGKSNINVEVDVLDNYSGVGKVYYYYKGNKETVYSDNGKYSFSINEANADNLTIYCEDNAGNLSRYNVGNLKIDNNMPMVENVSDKEKIVYQVPATFKVLAKDNETGIKAIYYSINGGGYVEGVLETTSEKDGLTVSAICDIVLDKRGDYNINVKAVDYAGNETVRDFEYEVVANSIIKVDIPTEAKLIIDPYNMAGKGQIYSSDIEVTNYGEEDIKVNVTKAIVKYAKDDTSNGTIKKCNLLLKLNNGEGKAISEGVNKDVMTFKLGCNEENAKAVLTLGGSVNAGSEMLWQDEDVTVRLIFTFEQIDY